MTLWIKKAGAKILRAPLVHAFRTARGQHDEIKNVLFRIELNNGAVGWGEAGIATHITGETVPQTLQILNKVAAGLAGCDPVKLIPAALSRRFAAHAAAKAAFEIALMDALTRTWKMPLWLFFGPRPKCFQTGMTLVISSEEDSLRTASEIWARGIRNFKIKVGRDLDSDLKRVLAVSKKFPRARLEIDANQGYDAAESLKFLKALRRCKIYPALIEQPVAKGDWEGLKKVTRTTRIPVIADESASSLSDVRRIIRTKAAAGINIKLMKFGLFDSLQAATLVKAAGLKLMIGQMMESMIAVSAAAQLAAGLGSFDYYDLDSVFFLSHKVTRGFHPSQDGRYDVRKISRGLGVVPR